MINSQTPISIEKIVEQFGSMTNYIKSQLITNPNFVALSPDEENYEEKLLFLQRNGEKEFIEKYHAVDDLLYQQFGLEKPTFNPA